jgi:hypothetical protein
MGNGVPRSSAGQQERGARLFAAIAIFLFACYLIGAVVG